MKKKLKKEKSLWNIHQGELNLAEKECLGSNLFKAKESYLMKMLGWILA